VSNSPLNAKPDVASQILLIRGQRVLLDSTLAALYGVVTFRFNEAVKRNQARFPADFAFRLKSGEFHALTSQYAMSKRGRGGRRSPPMVFTEHGAIMAATVLNSPKAIEMSVYVVRAFVRLRQLVQTNSDLARKLGALERSVARLDTSTRAQFEDVYATIKALMVQPPAKHRPIGFTVDLEE
jgi:hypothetical protein